MKTFKIYFVSASLLLAGVSVASAKQGVLEKAKAKAKANTEAKAGNKTTDLKGSGDKKGGIAVKKQGSPTTGTSSAASTSPTNQATTNPVK